MCKQLTVQVADSQVAEVVSTACAQTALAISLGDPRLLGKQGALHPVRGNAATTAAYVREHALLMEQQAAAITQTTFRDLQAREQLLQKTTPEKLQVHQVEESFTCCMCFSCSMLQPEQPKQRNVGLPSADVGPLEGRVTSQDGRGAPNRSEQIGSPLSSVSKHLREASCQKLQTGGEIDRLDPLESARGDSKDENLNKTGATKAPTTWGLNRYSKQHACTAKSNSCHTGTGEDASNSPGASTRQRYTRCCILDEVLQSKGQGCCKVEARTFCSMKEEETRPPAAHTDSPADLAQTQ